MTATFDELREEILSLCADLDARTDGRNVPHTAERLRQAAARLTDGKLVVIFCGEFKRGKSTLLNALLDQRIPLFPVAPTPKTRLITSVAYGETEQYFAKVTGPDGATERKPITREDIETYVGEPDHAGSADSTDAVMAEILLPDRRLGSGLVLMDTPGVGGIHPVHSKITEHVLPTADAIVFVASVTEPLREAELDFLYAAGTLMRASDTRDGLLVALNMIDTRTDYADLLTETRRRVAERTGRTLAQTPVLPVSGLHKMHYLDTGDKAFLEESGIPELEAALWKQLADRRIRVLLGGTLAAVEETANAILKPLRAEEASLRDRTGRRLAELEEETTASHARLVRLREENAQWRTDMRDQLALLGREMTQRAARIFDEVWQRGETELLAQEWYLTRPARLEQQLNSEFALAMSGVDEWGGRRATAIQQECAARCGLKLSTTALRHTAAVSIVSLLSFQTLKAKTRKIRHDVPETRKTIGGGYVSRTGGKPNLLQRGAMAIAKELGKGAERVTAKMVGVSYMPETTITSGDGSYYTTGKEGISPAKLSKRRTELLEVLREARPRQHRTTVAAVAEQIEDFAEAITAEMDSLIAQELETLDNTLPLLEQARTRTETEARSRLGELAAEQQPFVAVLQAVERLSEEVEELPGTDS
ncbi:dynamin family protein [Streptomyces sp. NPDC005388]|uniref:dynamin family protein n=1 Tax=Streptomyces sp. NPDC005388 TaxID=3156717 RepID=UPI0033A71731